MKIADFLDEFPIDEFPFPEGPRIRRDSHDPPFTDAVLNQMHKSGIIVWDKNRDEYALTLKATNKKYRV